MTVFAGSSRDSWFTKWWLFAQSNFPFFPLFRHLAIFVSEVLFLSPTASVRRVPTQISRNKLSLTENTGLFTVAFLLEIFPHLKNTKRRCGRLKVLFPANRTNKPEYASKTDFTPSFYQLEIIYTYRHSTKILAKGHLANAS